MSTAENLTPTPAIQMLWVEGTLSRLEELAICSFLRCGHPVHLYTYGLDAPPPTGVRVFDAAQVIQKKELFRHPGAIGHGSWATFSDIFRFTLLYENGGIWCDADMVCLKPLTFIQQQDTFFSSEYLNAQRREAKANNGAIGCLKGDTLIGECLDAVRKLDLRTAEWASSGPGVVNEVIRRNPSVARVLHPDIFCSVPHWEMQSLLFGARTITPAAFAIHFWNEVWRWNFFDKNARYEPFSLFERLKSHYLTN